MMAVEKPNYTQVPNSLFSLMPLMGDAELRCTLALVRKILGYHKDVDPVSYSQLMQATGLTRQGVRNGLKAAIERETVKIVGTGKQGINRYTLNFVGDENQLVNAVDQSTPLTKTSLPRRHTKEKKERTDPKGSDAGAKPPRKRSENQLKLDAMKNALADAFGLDRAKVTATKWNEFGKSGKELLDAGATPDDIHPLYLWCKRQGWKGVFTSVALAKNYAEFDKQRGFTITACAPVSDAELIENQRAMGLVS